MSHNKDLTLSAIDFLGLADDIRVEKVNLADIGRKGNFYIRELSTDDRRKLMNAGGRRVGRKARINKDKSMDITLPDTAETELLKLALVTDETGETLMYNIWLQELGTASAVNDRLNKLPHAVVNLIARKVREISGLLDDDKDEVEEKKES